MKQFYALAILAFFTQQSSAQFSQNFDAVNALTSGCNLSINADRTTVATEVISGTASLFANPSLNGGNTKDYSTPYLNVINPLNSGATTTSLNIAFKYKLSEELTGAAVRTIQVALQSPTGCTYLAIVSMNADNDPITPVSFNHSFIVPTGVYRLVLKMGGSQGSGSVRVIVDDVQTSANAYYTFNGTCNTAPLVNNDVYFTSNFTTPTTFYSVLANDSELDNERFAMPVVTTASPNGTVVFNSDGSFTFTPNPGFTGILTTFTYTVFDKGYDAMSSTGVVTIYFMASAVLPVKLVSFNGILIENNPFLSWSVANNEDGARMEVEKSTDGRNFSTISVVMPTAKQGDEKYEFKEGKPLEITSYYRLKIINKNNTVSYSPVIMLSIDKSATDVLTLTENPVRNSVRFSLISKTNATATINMYDIAGKKLSSRQLTLQKGNNMMAVELDSKISTGTYLLEIVTGAERKVARFVKQ
jgi:hypothetical protein